VSEKCRDTRRRTPGFKISQIHEQTPASIESDELPFLISENVQARPRNIVDFNKRFEDMKEAGEYVVFALDEQLAIWKIYNKGI
jgi:hypothetical protein